MKKTCFVPTCKNNSDNAPNKLFVYVPRQPELRKLWCDAVGCKKSYASVNCFCCEDHFNIVEDAENFLQYKIGQSNLKIKKGIVPTKFIERPLEDVHFTQTGFKRKLVFDLSEVPSTSKQSKGKEDKILAAANRSILCEEPEPSTSTSKQIIQIHSNEPSSSSSSEEVVSSPSKFSQSSSNESPSKSSESSALSSDNAYRTEVIKKMSKDRIVFIMEMESRFYLGLQKEIYFIIKLVSQHVHLEPIETLITLKKIRLNDPYLRMGHDFGVSSSYIGKTINKSIKPLALFFKNIIIWPTNQIIFQNLPLSFRRRYSKVTSIIDCFEIQIQKPANPLHQALTWSSYKNANTLKYLISITPFGLINFVSEGFGGRISDVEIVQQSGYLDVLPDSSTVMSDRGFKNLSHILGQKKCILVRPPSVEGDKGLSKEQVLEGKRIASLRIHVERLISRVREFELLKPHAVVDIHFLGKLNFAVIIACGIINLQPSLLRS